jgi:hypothetical protein
VETETRIVLLSANVKSAVVFASSNSELFTIRVLMLVLFCSSQRCLNALNICSSS